MLKMNVLIVDDEQLARQRLRKMLTTTSNCHIIGEAVTGEDALKKSQQVHPDVILMDIRMPGMDGIEAASYINKMDKPPAIIFTTAYSDHALDAFETHAVDYLVKPIKLKRLEKALNAAKRLNKAQFSHLRENSTDTRTKICVKSRGSLELIPIEEILYFKADQKYVTLRTEDNEYLIEESLKALEDEFAEQFIRIHRNALIASKANFKLSKSVNGHSCIQFAEIDDQLEISRRHLPSIRRIFKQLKSS